MSTCTELCCDLAGRTVRCSLDAEHALRGEHHFAADGAVEWPCYSDDATEPVRISGRRSALAQRMIGDAAAPGGQLA